MFWHIRKLHKGKAELTAAPGAGETASRLSQLILCKKQRSAVGQSLILQFHPHIKILQPVIILTLGLSGKSLLYLARIWVVDDLCYGACCVYSRIGVRSQPVGE